MDFEKIEEKKKLKLVLTLVGVFKRGGGFTTNRTVMLVTRGCPELMLSLRERVFARKQNNKCRKICLSFIQNSLVIPAVILFKVEKEQ